MGNLPDSQKKNQCNVPGLRFCLLRMFAALKPNNIPCELTCFVTGFV